MSRGDHLGFTGIVLAFFGIGVAILYPQQREIGVAAFVLSLLVFGRWVWVSSYGSVESLRSEWLGLEAKFQGVHHAAPRPTSGVPWHGGNPHPFARWDGRQWELNGENTELRKQMEALCLDAGSLLLRSPKLRRTLVASIRREKDPVVRWLKVVHANQKFTKKFDIKRTSGSDIETAEVGFIEFLPNVSARVARRCAAIC